MFTYEVVKIKMNWLGKYERNMDEVIQDYALDGWRLVQVLQPNSMNMDHSYRIIFEKPIRDNVEQYARTRFEGMV
ncbi:MAG: DUF4177 domain-containing protein [Saprospiraceae bacterium]